jgi:hypothetical protein
LEFLKLNAKLLEKYADKVLKGLELINFLQSVFISKEKKMTIDIDKKNLINTIYSRRCGHEI